MRKIWIQENELMQQLVPVLKNMTCEEPTDVFFFEVVPVPPPNLRPVLSTYVSVLHKIN